MKKYFLQRVQDDSPFFDEIAGRSTVVWWIFLVPHFVGVCLVFSSLTIYCWLIIEKQMKYIVWNDANKRTFKNKAVQMKLNLYIKKYMKKTHYKYSNIVCWIFLSVCMCVYM